MRGITGIGARARSLPAPVTDEVPVTEPEGGSLHTPMSGFTKPARGQ